MSLRNVAVAFECQASTADGRKLLRPRTRVVNNTVHLARELAKPRTADHFVYAYRPRESAAELLPENVHARCLSAHLLAWKHVAQAFESEAGTACA